VDDGKFVPHSKSQVPIVGIVFRGGYWLEGVMSTLIVVDGFDATENIAKMIANSQHQRQLRVIMLSGITFGGFNVVDIKALSFQTGLPVIAVTDRKPNLDEVYAALKHLPRSQERWAAVLNAGNIFSVTSRDGRRKIYVEIAGISKPLAEQVLRLTSTRSKIPEPLRVAHLVASGISLNTTQGCNL
jgi:endonuclease V-like protein UPF0215 family